ncbi:MAG: DHA2 family efflux MFS transporter permease subunit [Paracoccus sp. (in: a-proteobacteria)]|nr:DHA2 family efflux MFS transporter permease subunit [Paracoccus sp. (in: a-proteobacteria)]
MPAHACRQTRTRCRMTAEPPPLKSIASRPGYVWIVVATVCIGAFMGQLDASITQLVLPRLEVHFDSQVDAVSWVAVVYMLTVAAMLPVFGRLAEIFGRKLLYSGGFLIFVIGSALCGFAPSLEWMLAARVLQAIGSSLLAANSVAIIVSITGPHQRGRALGIQAAVQAVGMCAGPALGGIILSVADWRWVFWINVPVGIAGCLVSLLVLPQSDPPKKREGFDLTGALYLVPGLTLMMLGINQAGSWGLTSPAILGAAVVALVLLTAFVHHEIRAPAPLVTLSLFGDPRFSLGNIASFLAYAILFGLFFLMPFLFERIHHESPLRAGLLLTVIPIALAVLAPLSGGLSDRIGSRAICTLGMLIAAAGLAGLFWLLRQMGTDVLLVTAALGVVGIGLGLFVAPNNSAIMGVPGAAAHVGQAGAMMNVIRNIGSSTGIAVAAGVLAWRMQAHGGATHQATPDALLDAIRLVVGLFVLAALAAAGASALHKPAGSSP